MTLNKETEFDNDYEPFEGGYDENGNEVKAELGMDQEYVRASKFTAADLQANLALAKSKEKLKN